MIIINGTNRLLLYQNCGIANNGSFCASSPLSVGYDGWERIPQMFFDEFEILT